MSHAEMLTSPEYSENHTLDSLFEIEDVLEYIAILQNKVKHYDNLKKYRVQTLSAKIDKINDQISKLKSIILNTMKSQAPNDKTMDFTPIGKVTRKKAIRKWIVDNEEEILAFLKSKKLGQEAIEVREKIVKKELNKVLDSINKKKVPGVSFDPGKESLSVVYEKEYLPKPKEQDDQPDQEINIEELDEISMGTMEI